MSGSEAIWPPCRPDRHAQCMSAKDAKFFAPETAIMALEVFMSNRITTLAGGVLIGAVLTSATLLSCQHMGNHEREGDASTQRNRYPDAPPASAPSDIGAAAAIAPEELRGILADMAHSHGDKIKLAWWGSTPLRPVEPPFRPFFEHTGNKTK